MLPGPRAANGSRMLRFHIALSLALVAGCATEGAGVRAPAECAGGKCDDPAPQQTCEDARYANGTCDLDLACAVPDYDCFTTFADDAAARTWYATQDSRKILAADDPKTVHARAVLDRGWAEFKRLRPVGKLAEHAPAVVVIEDEEPNAFVLDDLDRKTSVFAVVVHTGLLAHGDEAGQLGVIMHELQHAVALHVLPAIGDRIRRYYLAPEGDEPIGRLVPENPRAREAGEAARAIMTDIGWLDDSELGELPISAGFASVLAQVLSDLRTSSPGLCDGPAADYHRLLDDLEGALDPLDQSLDVIPDLAQRVATLSSGLRACTAQMTMPLVDWLAWAAGVTPAEMMAKLSEADRALIADKKGFDGLLLLTGERRAQLRALKAKLLADTGQPWTALRYFSAEEDADDVSVPVLRAAGIEPAALAGYFMNFLDDGAWECSSMLENGIVPPYGENLLDEHHASCWRIYHVEAYAAATGGH